MVVQRLWRAIRARDADVVRTLCADRVLVGTKDDDGQTPVCWAASVRSNTRVLKALVDCGADVAHRDCLGRTALMVACCHGHLSDAKALIELGSPIEQMTTEEETALTFAVVWNHSRVVRLLLRAGADPNRLSFGWSPLMYAALEGHAGVARVLLNHGADPDFVDEHGESVLVRAVRSGSLRLVRDVLDRMQRPGIRRPSCEAALRTARALGRDDIVAAIEEARRARGSEPGESPRGSVTAAKVDG